MDTSKFYDKGFRQRLRDNPKKVFADADQPIADDIEIVIVTNTKSTSYFIMIDPLLNDELLSIAAAKASTIGTIATVGSAATVCGTASTVGSVGSVGSAATSGDVNISKS